MKRILAIMMCLCMVVALAACGDFGDSYIEDEKTPQEEFAELQGAIKTQPTYTTKASVYKDLDGGDIFLTADIKNNSEKTMNTIKIAFVAWDIDGNPILIKSASGLTEDAYVKELNLGSTEILAGQTWLGETEEEVFGLRVASEQTSISYVEAIVISYSTPDGGEWTNPCYYEWKSTFGGQQLEDWMK